MANSIKGYKYPEGVQAKPIVTGKSMLNGTKEFTFGTNQNVFNTKTPYAVKLHKKHKNWIKGAIKHPGALHTELGVKKGNKIPAKKLASAAKKGGKLGQRARLAETLKKLKHKKHKMLCKKHKRMHCSTCG